MRYADPRPYCSFRREKSSAVCLCGRITSFAGMIEALEIASFEGNFKMTLDAGALDGSLLERNSVCSGSYQRLSWKTNARGLLHRYDIDR